jgi:hypothetical protein
MLFDCGLLNGVSPTFRSRGGLSRCRKLGHVISDRDNIRCFNSASLSPTCSLSRTAYVFVFSGKDLSQRLKGHCLAHYYYGILVEQYGE